MSLDVCLAIVGRGFAAASDWLSRQSLARFFAIHRHLERENGLLRAQIETERAEHRLVLESERAAHAAERKQMLDRLAPPLTADEGEWESEGGRHPMSRLSERVLGDQTDAIVDEFFASCWDEFLGKRRASVERIGHDARYERQEWEIETGQRDAMM
jgi:hypothetical protein